MKNSLADLNNYLFESIERLMDDELDDEGLDRERELEFRRLGENATYRYRLADQNPYFNVCNLFFREPKSA